MPRPQPAELWAELNERQQTYLTAIYDADQNAEANQRGGAFDWGHGPPASEWRWQTFSIKLPKDLVGYTSIQHQLRAKGEHDQGAGSSLAALRRRGLVEVMEDLIQTVLGLVPRVRVKLTTIGRATARAGLGHTAPKSAPRGMLSEWLWSNLVRLYRAGPDGLPEISPRGTPYEDRAPSHKALFFLQQMDRKGGRLVETRNVETDGEPYESPFRPGHVITPTERRVMLTDAGRAHYEQHVRCYAELWPDVEAPVPEQFPEGAHDGLADHKLSKPRGLLPRAAFLILVSLVRADLADHLWVKEQWGTYWKHWNQGSSLPPQELMDLPAGITNTQVPRITRSTTALARLLDHRGAPLAAQKPISRWLCPPIGVRDGVPEDFAVLYVTEAGRAHYAANLAEYRTLYDDVEAPNAPEDWSGRPSGR
ncbi:hypothetical protein AB0958_18630 [Streptomyces sp. NPDC006655]|uniref:hypothetical protein n=1 Tax=Streptomyces sp. NPDC006655 TaxID=3156898 RepID=UPI0034538939